MQKYRVTKRFRHCPLDSHNVDTYEVGVRELHPEAAEVALKEGWAEPVAEAKAIQSAPENKVAPKVRNKRAPRRK
jgi:hypothetical protein